jgi:hypothetical protein
LGWLGLGSSCRIGYDPVVIRHRGGTGETLDERSHIGIVEEPDGGGETTDDKQGGKKAFHAGKGEGME